MNSPEETMLMERDLDAVEAALSEARARHVDPVARELQELAVSLRDDPPRPGRTSSARCARGWRPGSDPGTARCGVRAAALRGRVAQAARLLAWMAGGRRLVETLGRGVTFVAVARPGGTGGSADDDSAFSAGSGRPPAAQPWPPSR